MPLQYVHIYYIEHTVRPQSSKSYLSVVVALLAFSFGSLSSSALLLSRLLLLLLLLFLLLLLLVVVVLAARLGILGSN